MWVRRWVAIPLSGKGTESAVDQRNDLSDRKYGKRPWNTVIKRIELRGWDRKLSKSKRWAWTDEILS